MAQQMESFYVMASLSCHEMWVPIATMEQATWHVEIVQE